MPSSLKNQPALSPVKEVKQDKTSKKPEKQKVKKTRSLTGYQQFFKNNYSKCTGSPKEKMKEIASLWKKHKESSVKK